MSAFPLGDDELVSVLRRLPTAHLLGSCSLVSTQFRRAATAATTDGITVRAGSINSSSFQQWLQQHGRALKGLKVLPSNTGKVEKALPANLLQQLPNLSSLLLGDAILTGHFWRQLPHMTGLTLLSVRMHSRIPSDVLNPALPRLPPAEHLRKLSLSAHQDDISSSATPVFSQMTALSQLSLRCFSLEPVVLQQLTQLEDLRLSAFVFTGTQGKDPALFALLEQLPHLTQLQLNGNLASQCDPRVRNDAAAFAALAVITTRTRLQHLKLHLALPEAAWSVLFSAECQLAGLRSLSISGCSRRREPCVCSPATFPGFSCLTGLQQLHLKDFTLDSDVLRKLTTLQGLQLQDVQLRSPTHAAALLEMLPEFKQLRLLAVESGSVTGDWGAAPLPVHAFPSPQVLTSQQLQHFRLGWVRLRGHFWQQLFQLQGLLPFLQGQPRGAAYPAAGDARAMATVPAVCSWMLVDAGSATGVATKVGYVSTEEVENLAQSFPQLTSCAISLDPAGVQLDALHALTALQELSISHASADTPQSLAAAFKHTASLKSLQLWFHGLDCGAECSSGHQLQALTALTQLTRLVCGCYCEAACSSSCPEGDDPGTLFEGRCPTNMKPAPSVWKQLMRQCSGGVLQEVMMRCVVS